jgi:ferric-dicitrate binding protein FerR (iron transport regulator)
MANDSEEAARWFAASRRGVMLHEERQDYENWLSEPGNATSLAEFQAVWQALGVAAGVAAPEYQAPAAHRRQFAAMVAFASATAVMLTRVDAGWWNTLDWWSR